MRVYLLAIYQNRKCCQGFQRMSQYLRDPLDMVEMVHYDHYTTATATNTYIHIYINTSCQNFPECFGKTSAAHETVP